MIGFETRPFAQPEWDAIAGSLEGLSLLQTWAYGEAKTAAGWRVERGVLKDGRDVVGAVQVLVRALPVVGGGLAWVNRGPLLQQQSTDSRVISSALAALRRHYVENRGFHLRIAPAWQALDDAVPVRGLVSSRVAGWASARIDLSCSPAGIRANFRSNWRNHLSKAERLGVEVERGDSEVFFSAFLEEYRSFLGVRRYATSLTPVLLGELRKRMQGSSALTIYRCHHQGTALGSALIVRYGAIAEYLAGTLLPPGRGMNAGQILLWRALCDMQAEGLAVFDVGGMDFLRTPKGIHEFKQGMSGEPYRLANEILSTGGGLRSRLAGWIAAVRSGRPSVPA